MAVRFENGTGLPDDYAELTEEGRRLARVNACTLQETPDDLVRAWSLFRGWYLETLPSGSFYKDRVPSSRVHYEMVHSLGLYGRNLWAIPRKFGKTSLIGREVPLLLMATRPNFSVHICRASQAQGREELSKLKLVLETDEALINDFGEFKPSRGTRAWSTDRLWANNGAEIKGVSLDSRQRGGQADLYVLDDPEYDKKQSTDVRMLRENLEHYLFHVVIPMLERKGSLFWVGTTINRQSLIYIAATGDDPRFVGYWNRQVRAAEYAGAGGQTEYLWSERWDADGLEEQKKSMGLAAYSAEYLNRPSQDTDRILVIHPRYGAWKVEGPPPASPFSDGREVSWWEPPAKLGEAEKEKKGVLRELLARMFIVLTVDPIHKAAPTPQSDFQAIVVSGFSRPGDVQWVLDCWQGKLMEGRFLAKIWELAVKWRARIIGIESQGVQEGLILRFRDQWAEEALRTGFAPRIFPIKHMPDEEKGSRCAKMDWRFDSYRIRLPMLWRNELHWRDLIYQIENLNLPIESALSYDDLIDALSMTQKIVRPTHRMVAGATPSERVDALQLIRDGEQFVKGTDMDAGQFLRLDQIDDEVLASRRKLMYGEEPKAPQVYGAGKLRTA